jgi:hypothetical protein
MESLKIETGQEIELQALLRGAAVEVLRKGAVEVYHIVLLRHTFTIEMLWIEFPKTVAFFIRAT